MRSTTLAVGSCLVLGLLIGEGEADDWPQYRHDAGRTAATADELPETLYTQWTRKFQTPRPAFPNEVRLRFDATYEPVAAGEMVFVPSMVNDSVTAFDAETGAEKWRFFTDGPVRFAPAVWDGKVYATSDDGHLYCLDARHGRLLWKFLGLPEGKRDRKLLGHGRLISLRPARGGPVVADGVVYFAAGIWPDDDVAVYGLDAKTGKPVWANDEANRIPKANMDHGVANLAGLTPQGYLALVGGHLVVPCGAQLPAFLDPKTGELKPYAMGWGGRVGLPKGSWFVAGAGKYLSHSGDLYDVTRSNDEKFKDPRGRSDFKNMLYPGGFTRIMIEPTNQRALGTFAKPVITDEALYFNSGERIVAYDLTKVDVGLRAESEPSKARTQDRYPDKLKASFKELWSLDTNARVHIRAGNRLYVGTEGQVAAVTLPANNQAPELTWQAKIEGTPETMLAANGRLFVVTHDGKMYVYGGKRRGYTHYSKQNAPRISQLKRKPAAVQKVAHACEKAGTREGYALVLGLEFGQTVRELLRSTDFHIISVDPDRATVERLRKEMHGLWQYGTRVEAHVGDPLDYPFPPYLASVILSEDGTLDSKEAAEKVFEQLRPYGGVAVYETEKGLAELTRPTGLPLAADWSHRNANAANSGASQDYFLKAPLGLLWYDASLRWHRKPGSAEVRVAAGRTIVKADTLYAIDVYTGRRIWERDLPDPKKANGDLVALGEDVYVGSGNECYVLDAQTGETRTVLELPEGASGGFRNLRAVDGFLVATAGKTLFAINRKTGKPAWTFECSISQLSVAVSNESVFCAELLNPRRGEDAKSANRKTRAFDLKTGKTRWEIAAGSEIRYSAEHDLLVTQAGTFAGKTGKRVRAGNPLAQIIGDRMVLGKNDRFTVFDLVSGERQGEELSWYRRGCTGLRSSCHLVTTRFKGNAAYVDLATREITPLFNIRSGCNNNLYPANGILNVPNVTGGCECNYTPVSKAFAPLAVIEK